MFEKQKIFCCICGCEFFTDFQYYGGYCCSVKCMEEINWRKALYITGEKYREKKEIRI